MSDKINDGGPAFPFGQVSEATGAPINGYHNDGMSLRDYFAGQAMQGICSGASSHGPMGGFKSTVVAADAYDIANAMLAARESIK